VINQQLVTFDVTCKQLLMPLYILFTFIFCVLLYYTYYFVCGLRSDIPWFINE